MQEELDKEDKVIEESEKEEKDFKKASELTSKWEKDEVGDEDAEVVKLDVDESVEGILLDRYASSKYNADIYKIQVKDDHKIKVIVGTTVLDKLMKPKEIGEIVKIKRLEDSVSQKGRAYQNWETYHLHKSSSAKKE